MGLFHQILSWRPGKPRPLCSVLVQSSASGCNWQPEHTARTAAHEGAKGSHSGTNERTSDQTHLGNKNSWNLQVTA